MGDQEMQFADPAWRPPQQGGIETDTQWQEPPLNRDTFEQAQQQYDPYANTASYSEGYRAQPPGGMPSISNIPLRTRQRRGRSPWLWFILALIIFSLISGAFTMSASRDGGFPGYGNFPKTDFFRHDHFQPFTQQFPIGGIHPTLVINDTLGSVTVHTGGPDDNNVAIQTDPSESKLLNVQPGSNDTFTINVNNSDPSAQVDLDVAVPSEADVEVTTGSGDIILSGVNGQVNLNSDSGGINLSQVSLSRNSVVKTNSGAITFDGVLDPNGTYQFQSRSGSVDVTLPSASSFHADITTITGSIDASDFPEVSVSSDRTSAHGDVGSPPRARVTMNTDSGSISLLHNGS